MPKTDAVELVREVVAECVTCGCTVLVDLPVDLNQCDERDACFACGSVNWSPVEVA